MPNEWKDYRPKPELQIGQRVYFIRPNCIACGEGTLLSVDPVVGEESECLVHVEYDGKEYCYLTTFYNPYHKMFIGSNIDPWLSMFLTEDARTAYISKATIKSFFNNDDLINLLDCNTLLKIREIIDPIIQREEEKLCTT